MDSNDILKYALQNAVKYDGKANIGAVIGKILAERPELKQSMKDLQKQAADIVKEVNQMKPAAQLEKLKQIAPELLEDKPKEEHDIFAFLELKVKPVTAFPPEPSKYPHIGHAKAIILNYELAKRNNGKFILRFEDTNPKLAKEEYYDIHLENYAWLGIKPDEIAYVSDHIPKLYEYAEKMISSGNAYMCFCDAEAMRHNRGKGIGCKCRDADDSLVQWHKFFEMKEGQAVLRAKIDMEHNNSTMRDPTLFRIIDEEHPRTGKKYRVWPNYDFENAVMDGIQGVTHRLRSKEFELRNELQRHIQKVLGFNETSIYEFARFNLEGVVSSGRVIREMIEKNELLGWDDPSLTTLVALRRRGFLPEAIKQFVLSTGISKAESVLTWDDLIVHNRRLLDKDCSRYFFVEEPVEIRIEGAPEQHIKLRLHPEDASRGFREHDVHDRFYISKKDHEQLKAGKLYRLMDCLNFVKKDDRLVFDSLGYEKFRNKGEKIMHFLPVTDKILEVDILMPDRKIVEGMAEPQVLDVKQGQTIQFERYGFCKLDNKDEMVFWWTHK